MSRRTPTRTHFPKLRLPLCQRFSRLDHHLEVSAKPSLMRGVAGRCRTGCVDIGGGLASVMHRHCRRRADGIHDIFGSCLVGRGRYGAGVGGGGSLVQVDSAQRPRNWPEVVVAPAKYTPCAVP